MRCNQPAGGFRLQRKLYWHHPAAYVALFISPIVYVIVAMIIRKNATVRIGLCPDHRKRRRNGLLIGWIGTAISLTACTAGLAADTPEALLGGLVLFLIFPIVGIVMAQTIVPKKMDEHCAWLKVGKLFLDSLEPARR